MQHANILKESRERKTNEGQVGVHAIQCRFVMMPEWRTRPSVNGCADRLRSFPDHNEQGEVHVVRVQPVLFQIAEITRCIAAVFFGQFILRYWTEAAVALQLGRQAPWATCTPTRCYRRTMFMSLSPKASVASVAARLKQGKQLLENSMF